MTQALPKHIADLCGILDVTGMDLTPPDPLPAPDRTGPISTRDNGDSTYTVLYFGKEAGHITRAKMPDRDARHYIAATVLGHAKRCYSLHRARCFIIENTF